MKVKALFVAIFAMSLFAVQGYAQGARGHAGHGHGSRTRTERSDPPGHGHSHGGYSNRGSTRSGSYTPPRQHHSHNHSYGSHHVTPPRHNNWRPMYNHHHSYHHHHHNCIFDSWSWYTWQGYTNRFIRHSLYHNRYFDSMLGYYLWDSFDSPTRIDIGTMSFTRYQGKLKVTTSGNVSYLDLYRYQKVTYQIDNTFVEVTTNGGYATLYFYDEYGNTATYRL